MPRVFLSHIRRDADLAANFARELRKHGVEPIDVESVAPGESFRRAVKSAIRRADAFVLILSAPEAAASSWVSYELGVAEALGKPILLVLSHNHTASQLPSDMAELAILSFDPMRPELVGGEIADRLLAAA